jgi:hypothetical protein
MADAAVAAAHHAHKKIKRASSLDAQADPQHHQHSPRSHHHYTDGDIDTAVIKDEVKHWRERRMGKISERSESRRVSIRYLRQLFNSDKESHEALRNFLTEEWDGIEDSVPISKVQGLLGRLNECSLSANERQDASDVVHSAIDEQLKRKANYLNLAGFLSFFALYLFVVYSANSSPSQAFNIQNAMEKQLLMEESMPVAPWGNRDNVFGWLDEKVVPLFADPICGNGKCDTPVEHEQWAHSGCMADCGYYGKKTNASLRVEVNFTQHLLLGEWEKDEWTNVVWDICSPTTHQGEAIRLQSVRTHYTVLTCHCSPDHARTTHQGLCAYNRSQELQQQYLPVGSEVKVTALSLRAMMRLQLTNMRTVL